jgi:hypothetical protein
MPATGGAGDAAAAGGTANAPSARALVATKVTIFLDFILSPKVVDMTTLVA